MTQQRDPADVAADLRPEIRRAVLSLLANGLIKVTAQELLHPGFEEMVPVQQLVRMPPGPERGKLGADWRRLVPGGVRDVWGSLPDETKLLVGLVAIRVAEGALIVGGLGPGVISGMLRDARETQESLAAGIDPGPTDEELSGAIAEAVRGVVADQQRREDERLPGRARRMVLSDPDA